MMPESRVAAPATVGEAQKLTLELYGVAVTAQSLPGEYDDNFQVIADDTRMYVLKIMHPAREISFVDMQCRALKYLAEHTPHLILPRVIPNLEDE